MLLILVQPYHPLFLFVRACLCVMFVAVGLTEVLSWHRRQKHRTVHASVYRVEFNI